MTDDKITIDQLHSDASWTFEGASRICIGRSPDNDICLPHPEVSRYHCEITCDESKWECRNLGRNGIYVEGALIDRFEISQGVVVRLSSGGPELRIRLNVRDADSDNIPPNDDPITLWINECRQGGESAASHLWDSYFDHILELARRRLRESTTRVADEEDVALGVMDSFFRGLREERFELDGREELWKLLVVITTRQAIEHMRNATRKKRGGGKVRGDSIFFRLGESGRHDGFDVFPGSEPTPELIAAVSDETDRLMEALCDEELRKIALLKLEDWKNDEIAKELGCSERTIERRLADIRAIWYAQLQDEETDV